MTGIGRMLAFINELKINNNRPWFAAHKGEYDAIRKACIAEIETLLTLLSRVDSNLVNVTPEECIYRIYRDIRFSPDKSPFKTHFGIVLAKGGRKCKEAGYYLHIEPEECALYGGVWFPEQPVLKFLRRNIYDNMDEFLEILTEPAFKKNYPALVGDSLKTLPQGYPKDCEHGDIIKMKEFLVMKRYKETLFARDGWQKKVADDVRVMKPFVDFLNYAFEEWRMA